MLAALAGEEDETSLVGLQTGDVEREGFFGEVGATAVDWDTDGRSQLAGNACFL